MLLLEDRNLLKRFREGDRQAMTTVFEHYCDSLARYLTWGFSFQSKGETLHFSGLRHRHDLHDVVAETFRRAFEERARLAYAGISPYESYLRTIARNLVIDRLRSREHRLDDVDLQPDNDLPHAASAPPSPERAYQDEELARIIRTFLTGASAAEKELVTLRHRQGLSQEETAKKMKKTRRYVRALESGLRARLLAHLKDTGYLPATVGGR